MPLDFVANTDAQDPNAIDSLLESYKRLRELNGSNAKPVTQTIKTDPVTGEETVTVSGSKHDLSPANPLTPTVIPSDYNQYIGQQESGANPNIGYHNPALSTAYGQFGITAPAYADIQSVAPQFANRDISSLSPQEQIDANNVLKAQYEKQLSAKGIEPTEANVRLAHLLGAGGAHQYLTQGTVSPEAAAANGGEDKLKQLAQARLGSAMSALNPIGTAQAAQTNPTLQNTPLTPEQPNARSLLPGYGQPATNPFAGTPRAAMPGQAQPPAGPVAPTAAPVGTTLQQDVKTAEEMGPPTSLMTSQGWAERFATAQQNPKMVAEMAFDPNAPQWVRGAAEQHLGNVIGQKRAEQAAQGLLDKANATGDFTQVGKEIQRPNEEGSWLKYIVFKSAGWSEAAGREANRLGLMDTTHVANGPNGEHGLITYDGRNNPKSGVDSNNKPIPQDQLNAWASLGENNAAMLKTAQTQAIQTFASTKNYLDKKAFETRQAMGREYDLSQDGLAPGQIQAKATQAAEAVMAQARATHKEVATNAPVGSTASYVTGRIETPVVGGVEQPTAEGAANNQQHVKSIAEKIANYEMPAPTSRSGPYATIMREVSKLNPEFDQTKFATAQATRKEFTKLTGTSGGAQVQALNRAVPHMEQYEQAVTALQNGKMPLVNDVLNTYHMNVGDDKVAGAKAIQGLVSAELQKAIAGGLGGVDEREALSKQLATNLNPEQLTAVIKQMKNMMLVSGQGLKQNWTSNGLPEKEFDSKLVPKTREAFTKHLKEENNTRSKW